MLAWTKQNIMQRAMRTVLEWPQSHATSKHYTYYDNKKILTTTEARFQSFIADTVGWVEKYNVSLRKRLQQGISEPEFYGDLVYRIRKIVGKSNFAEQFRKLINRYKRIGYNPHIMRKTACLVVNPITVDSYALLFNCTTVVRASD